MLKNINLPKTKRAHHFLGPAFCECGTQLKYRDGPLSSNSATVDIINPDNKVMSIDNIKIVCWRCNVLKFTSKTNGIIAFAIKF